ncbi:MAG: ferrochelatase [bacterium]|nr:ferrochelatase [bacterium]
MDSKKHGKIGILIINTGTPDDPSIEAIQRYLAEFLMDPMIISVPRPIWRPILNLFILPRRPKKTIASYRKIWTENGSPFTLTSQAQRDLLAEELAKRGFNGGDFEVGLAMRYGSMSVGKALSQLESAGCGTIVALPLFPQETRATVGTCLKKVRDELAKAAKGGWKPELIEIPSYSDQRPYIDGMVELIERQWNYEPGSKLLFSFHSTLVADIEAGDPYCDQIEPVTKAIASRLGIASDDCAIGYQSRFDTRKWLKPSVESVLARWVDAGAKNVAIAFPGFVADCIETLVEIPRVVEELRAAKPAAREVEFTYVSALNESPQHIEALANAIEDAVSNS